MSQPRFTWWNMPLEPTPYRCAAPRGRHDRCEVWFAPTSINHRFCSNACRQRAFAHRFLKERGVSYKVWQRELQVR